MGRNSFFIGEVAARSGVSRKALRLYEAAGILPTPSRSAARYRLYGQETLALLGFVAQARRLGFTLKEIRQIVSIKRSGRAPRRHVRDLVRRKVADLDRTLTDPAEVRGALQVPRRELVRRIFERALWGTQMRPAFDPVTGLPRAKGKKVPIRGAMVADLVARLQRIVETGDDGTVLRLAQLIHEIMRPGKGEGSGERPQRVAFVDIPSGLDQAKAAEAPPATPAEPPIIVDREGNEYVQP
jgi:DNA-binding transcriptional MerR regulator